MCAGVCLLPIGAVFEYLSAVLCHVLHSQREPLPLCLGLLQYDRELASSEPPVTAHISVVQLHRYYSKWLPQQCHVELVSFSYRAEVQYTSGCI